MTDKIFYHPETGKPLHRVPEGATIPEDTPYGVIYADGDRAWRQGGCVYEITLADCPLGSTFFTAEPIAPPVPPLPTEPGATISATGEFGRWCEVMIRTCDGRWFGVDDEGLSWTPDPEDITDWYPVMVVPNGHGVLDETDKRPVVDSRGHQWDWVETRDLWTRLRLGDSPDPPSLNRGTKAAINRAYGPLDFADGSAS